MQISASQRERLRRVPFIHPVGDPLADPVKLNASTHRMTIG